MTHLGYPFEIDGRGRSGMTDHAGWVRDLIEQVLFTAPGERVNRPDFGSGLRQLVFAPNSTQLAASTQTLVQGALQRFLGGLITVARVGVEVEDSTFRVIVEYRLVEDGSSQRAEIVREL